MGVPAIVHHSIGLTFVWLHTLISGYFYLALPALMVTQSICNIHAMLFSWYMGGIIFSTYLYMFVCSQWRHILRNIISHSLPCFETSSTTSAIWYACTSWSNVASKNTKYLSDELLVALHNNADYSHIYIKKINPSRLHPYLLTLIRTEINISHLISSYIILRFFLVVTRNEKYQSWKIVYVGIVRLNFQNIWLYIGLIRKVFELLPKIYY